MFDIYRHYLLLTVLKTQDVEMYRNWFQIKYKFLSDSCR
jgi:hypothetical protein